MCDFDDYMLSVRPHGLLAAKKATTLTARVPVAIVYIVSFEFPIYHFFDLPGPSEFLPGWLGSKK